MKRKWRLIGMVVLPAGLLAMLGIVRNALLWQPHFIMKHPGGSCYLNWSDDGLLVQACPTDRNSRWGTRSIPIDARFSSARGVPSSVERFELQSGKGWNPSVVLLNKITHRKIPLQNTPFGTFGYDVETNIDGIPAGWRFQDSRFSADWREVSIVDWGTIYTWSTSTGKLLHQVCFDGSEELMHTSKLSPDGRLVIDCACKCVGGDFVRAAAFDTQTGKKKFTLPINEDFWGGFSLDSKIGYVSLLGGGNWSNQDVFFFDTQTGKSLWSIAAPSMIGVKFLPEQDSVAVPYAERIEIREAWTGKLQRILKSPAKYIIKISPSPDGSQIWASYYNGQIWSWRLQ